MFLWHLGFFNKSLLDFLIYLKNLLLYHMPTLFTPLLFTPFYSLYTLLLFYSI
jgi:hypothetical protein